MALYRVRPAVLGDADEIASVAMASWESTYGSIYPPEVIRRFVSNAYSPESLNNSIALDMKSRRGFSMWPWTRPGRSLGLPSIPG